MTCKDCIHSGLCYKENDYDNFPNRCGDFISKEIRWTDKVSIDADGNVRDFNGKILYNLKEAKNEKDIQ